VTGPLNSQNEWNDRNEWKEPAVLGDADCERLLQPDQRVDSALGDALRTFASVADGDGDGAVVGEAAALAAFRAHAAGLLAGAEPAGGAGRYKSDWRRRLGSRAAALSFGGLLVVTGGAAAAAETGVVPNFVHPVLVHLHIESSHPASGSSGHNSVGTATSNSTGDSNSASSSSPGSTTSPPPGLSSDGKHKGNGNPQAAARHDNGRGHAYGNPAVSPSATSGSTGSNGQGSGSTNGKHNAYGHTSHTPGTSRKTGTSNGNSTSGNGRKTRRHGTTSQGKHTGGTTKPTPTPSHTSKSHKPLVSQSPIPPLGHGKH